MAIQAGTVDQFSGSLAEAIENALKAEYLHKKGEALPDQGVEDRRILLVAIAQGVVRYFKDHRSSFEISVETTLTSGGDAVGTGTLDDIATTGTLY